MAVAAGVVRMILVSAFPVRALSDMPAQRRCPAGYNCLDDRELLARLLVVSKAEGKVHSQDIRDFMPGTGIVRRIRIVARGGGAHDGTFSQG